jgi:hypothetical protein
MHISIGSREQDNVLDPNAPGFEVLQISPQAIEIYFRRCCGRRGKKEDHEPMHAKGPPRQRGRAREVARDRLDRERVALPRPLIGAALIVAASVETSHGTIVAFPRPGSQWMAGAIGHPPRSGPYFPRARGGRDQRLVRHALTIARSLGSRRSTFRQTTCRGFYVAPGAMHIGEVPSDAPPNCLILLLRFSVDHPPATYEFTR